MNDASTIRHEEITELARDRLGTLAAGRTGDGRWELLRGLSFAEAAELRAASPAFPPQPGAGMRLAVPSRWSDLDGEPALVYPYQIGWHAGQLLREATHPGAGLDVPLAVYVVGHVADVLRSGHLRTGGHHGWLLPELVQVSHAGEVTVQGFELGPAVRDVLGAASGGVGTDSLCPTLDEVLPSGWRERPPGAADDCAALSALLRLLLTGTTSLGSAFPDGLSPSAGPFRRVAEWRPESSGGTADASDPWDAWRALWKEAVEEYGELPGAFTIAFALSSSLADELDRLQRLTDGSAVLPPRAVPTPSFGDRPSPGTPGRDATTRALLEDEVDALISSLEGDAEPVGADVASQASPRSVGELLPAFESELGDAGHGPGAEDADGGRGARAVATPRWTLPLAALGLLGAALVTWLLLGRGPGDVDPGRDAPAPDGAAVAGTGGAAPGVEAPAPSEEGIAGLPSAPAPDPGTASSTAAPGSGDPAALGEELAAAVDDRVDRATDTLRQDYQEELQSLRDQVEAARREPSGTPERRPGSAAAVAPSPASRESGAGPAAGGTAVTGTGTGSAGAIDPPGPSPQGPGRASGPDPVPEREASSTRRPEPEAVEAATEDPDRRAVAAPAPSGRAPSSVERSAGPAPHGPRSRGGHENVALEGPGVTPPVLVRAEQPAYPRIAQRRGDEASVPLRLLVDERGRVTDVDPVREVGMGFDSAAEKAARRFRFEAATFEGRPVKMWVTVAIEFRL